MNVAAKAFRGSWGLKIGLEIHAQLKVNSKIFSNTVALSNLGPNKAVSLFDAAYPGTLPVLNKSFVSQSVKAALALNCKINPVSYFDRKHYFYLDLPLGYQITQYSKPVAEGGVLNYRYHTESFENSRQKIKIASVRIERVQMEQDSGKSIHDLHPDYSLVDLNRAGTGLIEIVFLPDIESPVEAAAVLRSTQEILRYIDVSDANLESGGMRCDVNVSVHRMDGSYFSKRVEIKNLNSMQRVRDASTHEANRLIDILEAGNEIVQETRGYDPIKGITYSSREKETAVDYRYLPDPDLPGVAISIEEIETIKGMIEELPVEAILRLQREYSLSEEAAENLVNKQGGSYFEMAWKEFQRLTKDFNGVEAVGNKATKLAIPDATAFYFWMTGELQGHLNILNTAFGRSPISPLQFGKILSMLQVGKLSSPQTKNIIAAYFSPKYINKSDIDPEELARIENMCKITDVKITRDFCIKSTQNPKHSSEWNNLLTGKGRMANFFLGDVMKLSKGTLDPATILKVLEQLKAEANSKKKKQQQFIYCYIYDAHNFHHNTYDILGSIQTKCMQFVLPLILQFSLQQTQPETVYVSFSAPITENETALGYMTNLTSIMDSDDSPFARIDLPFSFQYFGVSLNRMFVSPNGAIHTTAFQPCQCNCFMDGGCKFLNTSYYGVIAGFLADLFPAGSKGGISYATNDEYLLVYYDKIPFFFKPNSTNSFSVKLGKDGHVVIKYYDVDSFTTQTFYQTWSSGLRAPQDPTQMHTVFSSDQIDIQENNWKTAVQGIYPLKNLVKSGYQFIACPISTSWCLTPTSIQYTANQTIAPIELSPISSSCYEELTIGILLNSQTNSSLSSGVIACETRVNSSSVVQYICNISSFLSEQLSSNLIGINFDVNLVAISKVFGSVNQTNNLSTSIAPLTLSINVSNSTEQCMTNSNLDEYKQPCDLCENSVVESNLTCSGLDIYSYPICSTSTNCSRAAYYDNRTKSCCEISDIDCFGICFGTSVIAPDDFGVQNCCEQSKIDCLGICSGSAQRDVCGICNGMAASIDDCNDGDSGLQSGAAWPMIGRNQYRNAASPFRVVASSLQNTLWDYQLCIGEPTAPIIDNQGVVYLGCKDGSMFALVEKGMENNVEPVVWNKFVIENKTISTDAMIDNNNLLYFGLHDGQIYAIDAYLFETRWKSNIYADGAITVNPIIYQGVLFVIRTSKESSSLYALNCSTGAVNWLVNITKLVKTVPFVTSDTVMVLTNTSEVFIFSIYDGLILSTFQIENDNHSMYSSVASVGSFARLPDRSVLVTSFTGRLLRFVFDITDSSITTLYNISGHESICSSPVLDEVRQLVVSCSCDGIIRAIDMKSGVLKWEVATNSSILSNAAASIPTNTLIVPLATRIILLNISTGALVASKKIDKLGAFRLSHVAISADGGILLSTSNGYLIRLGGQYQTCPSGMGVSTSLNSTSVYESSIECSYCGEGYHSSMGVCSPCTPGNVANISSMTYCLPCAAGSYVSSFVSVQCGLCHPGTFSGMGQGDCSECAMGEYASDYGTTDACSKCELGKYSDLMGSSSCSICDLGYTTEATGSNTCVRCQAGTFGVYGNHSYEGAVCQSCPKNSYSEGLASTLCEPCQAGEFTESSNSVQCQECSFGTYYDPSHDTCQGCSWPKFAVNSIDQHCKLYFLLPSKIARVDANIVFSVLFASSTLLVIKLLDISLNVAQLQAQFVITRLGFFFILLPGWLEQYMQAIYLINMPFQHSSAFVMFILLRFAYPYVATAVMIRQVMGSWRSFKETRMIQIVFIGGCFYISKAFALRTVYNNFFRLIEQNRLYDYVISPIVVEFYNYSTLANTLFQTVPLLAMVLTNKIPRHYWYQQLLHISYLVVAGINVVAVLRFLVIDDTYSIGTSPLSIRIWRRQWLYVYGNTDGLQAAAVTVHTAPVRARPVAINDHSYDEVPVASATISTATPDIRLEEGIQLELVTSESFGGDDELDISYSTSSNAYAVVAVAEAVV